MMNMMRILKGFKVITILVEIIKKKKKIFFNANKILKPPYAALDKESVFSFPVCSKVSGSMIFGFR